MKTRRELDAPPDGAFAGRATAPLTTGPLTPIPLRTTPGAGRVPWLRTTLRRHTGQARIENEDCVFALATVAPGPGETLLPFGFFAVADGMGGLDAGGAAAQLVMRLAVEHVTRELLAPALAGQGGSSGRQTIAETLADAVAVANRALYDTARRAGAPSGTTFSAAVLLGRQLVTAHVGDSRIYLFGPDGLQPLTHDHSMVARLVAIGGLTAAEAHDSPQRGALYRALGQATHVEAEVATRAWRGARYLLLCSDGLWDPVGEEPLAAVLRDSPDMEAAADACVRLANERGGPDNISLILVELPQDAA
jgi:PPM family protein phosphatase